MFVPRSQNEAWTQELVPRLEYANSSILTGIAKTSLNKFNVRIVSQEQTANTLETKKLFYHLLYVKSRNTFTYEYVYFIQYNTLLNFCG